MLRAAFLLMAAALLVGCVTFTPPTVTPRPTATPTPLPSPTPPPSPTPTPDANAEADAARGEQIFRVGINNSPPCVTCHLSQPGGLALGPNLHGVWERAATRVAGLSADEYLHHSILTPNEYVVGGYRPIMYPQYRQHFDDQDIADLIAYLKTL